MAAREGLGEARRTSRFLVGGILNRSEGDSCGGVGSEIGDGESEGRREVSRYVGNVLGAGFELCMLEHKQWTQDFSLLV